MLVTGPTGSGQVHHRWPPSSTRSTARRPIHIITIEDPIEYLHPHQMATINQREVGADTQTFALALRARPAPGAQGHPGRRDARRGDDLDRARGLGDRPPRALHPAHDRRQPRPSTASSASSRKNEERQVRTRFSQAFKWDREPAPRAQEGRRPRRRSARSCAPTRAPRVRAGGRARGQEPASTPWTTACSRACRPSTTSWSGSSTRASSTARPALSYATNRTNLLLRASRPRAWPAQVPPSGSGTRCPLRRRRLRRHPAAPPAARSDFDDLIERWRLQVGGRAAPREVVVGDAKAPDRARSACEVPRGARASIRFPGLRRPPRRRLRCPGASGPRPPDGRRAMDRLRRTSFAASGWASPGSRVLVALDDAGVAQALTSPLCGASAPRDRHAP